MFRLIRLVLLIAAFAGLMAQPVAFAAVPMTAAALTQAPLMTDCDEMAAMSDNETAPCKKMTSDCAATMGCAVSPFVASDRTIAAMSGNYAISATWPAIRALVGRTLIPEPHPPHA